MIEPWTDDQLKALKSLRANGMTCARIAARLNVYFRTSRSRNAVIGKLWRMKQQEGNV